MRLRIISLKNNYENRRFWYLKDFYSKFYKIKVCNENKNTVNYITIANYSTIQTARQILGKITEINSFSVKSW